jgi:ABC-type transport system substrate-binding protein
MRLDEAPFNDIRVRQALNMSLDREAIAQSIYFGNAETVPSGIICKTYTGYAYDYEDWPQELKDQYAYNVEGARALLAQTDWPNGFDTTLICSSAGSTEIYEILKNYFHDIGVEVTITPMETAAYEAMFRSPDHHGLVSAGGGMTFNPFNTLQQFWSQGADQGASMVNDPAYDALYDQYGAAANASEAMSICREADKYIIEQHWLVAAGESYSAFNAAQRWIKGWSGESLFWGCQNWLAYIWIDASLK